MTRGAAFDSFGRIYLSKRSRIVSHRLHVLKIPTTWQSDVFEENLFPYTHYSDAGHNPRMTVHAEGEQVLLRCSDRVKLHPNYAQTLRNRADIYMPGNGAAGLALAIIAITGPGDVAELANVDPEGAARTSDAPIHTGSSTSDLFVVPGIHRGMRD